MSFADVAVIHLAATGFMAGLISTIHVVHYPLFGLVNEPYEPFQRAHMARITKLLLLPWGIETLSAVALVMLASPGSERVLSGLGLGLTVAIVGLTGALAAPLHGQLVESFHPGLHQRLMRVDAVRMALWLIRLGVALLLVGA